MAARALLATAVFAASVSAGCVQHPTPPPVNSTTCNGAKYTYDELAGYGYLVGDSIDKFGDTLGGIGSSLHMDESSWVKLHNGSYSGILWSVPDRGWNTEGTLNYNPRVHKFQVLLNLQRHATVSNPASPNLHLTYLDTIKFSGPDGTPCTGLDPDGTGHLSYPGFPNLPVATYEGDGFGGSGPGGKRVPVDVEGLAVNADGSFWISDEYGPYVYLFSPEGLMLAAIQPPAALVPMRNETVSFSSNSPPVYLNDPDGDDVSPHHPDSGRENNHGLEGLSVLGDSLYVLLQAATIQDGGQEKQTQRYTRFLKYDISNPLKPVYENEYVVPLPLFVDPTAKASKNPKSTAQSEVHALPNGQFFILSRDSNAGRTQDSTLSVYRQIDVFDVSKATDIKAAGDFDCATCAIADEDTGVLVDSVVPAEYCSFLDFNVNSQLNRFGVHNGGEDDAGLLNEKWESMGMVPVHPEKPNGEYFVFSLSDNDFVTQNGFMNGGLYPYSDASGYNTDNQALVFKITIS